MVWFLGPLDMKIPKADSKMEKDDFVTLQFEALAHYVSESETGAWN